MTDKLDMDSEGGDAQQNLMITVNNLNYLLEPDLTVAVNSTMKKQFFTQPSYDSGTNAICIMNSGADYIDFKRSYLSFTVQLGTTENTSPHFLAKNAAPNVGLSPYRSYASIGLRGTHIGDNKLEDMDIFGSVAGGFALGKSQAGLLQLASTAATDVYGVAYATPPTLTTTESTIDQIDRMYDLVPVSANLALDPGSNASTLTPITTGVCAPSNISQLSKIARYRNGKVSIGFGDGSALNLINRITISSRSGDEICRVENAALVNHVLMNYSYGTDWRKSVGSSFGADKFYVWEDATSAEECRARFHIPMYLLSGFFNYERLMPSMLTSGLRIQIEWNNAPTVFVANMDSAYLNTLNYTISNVHIDCKSIQLTDACQRYLNELSATSGLEIVYTDTNTTSVLAPSGGGDFYIEVRQACSRALRAWARLRNVKGKTEVLQDAFAGDHWGITSWQWRLGSLYFPQQPVKAFNTSDLIYPLAVDIAADDLAAYTYPNVGKFLDNAKETYVAALEMFGKLTEKGNTTSVTFDQFLKGPIPICSSETPINHGTKAKVLSLCQEAMGTSISSQSPDGTADYFGNAFKAMSALASTVRTADSATKLNANTGVVGNQYYLNDIVGFRKIYDIIKSDMPFVQFCQIAKYYGNHSIIPVNLERSTMFNLSGVPINNSRVLGLNLSLAPQVIGSASNYAIGTGKITSVTHNAMYYPPGGLFNHELVVTLQYIKLARVFLNNVEVEQ